MMVEHRRQVGVKRAFADVPLAPGSNPNPVASIFPRNGCRADRLLDPSS